MKIENKDVAIYTFAESLRVENLCERENGI